jgi:ATP-dependent Clp protease ATP-binding subunit ClpC
MRDAKELAIKLGSEAIDTIHVLQGIWNLEGSVACAVLKNLGVKPAAFKKAMSKVLVQGAKQYATGAKIPFTADMKEGLSAASESSKQMGSEVVGTEHLLLGVALTKGSASAILTSLGLNPEQIKEEIMSILGDQTQPQASPMTQNYKDAPEKTIDAHSKGTRETPHIDKYCVDLTDLARKGKLDPCIGRTKERKRILQILGRRTKNNPVLIGEPGTGKSAIVNGIAIDIVSGNVPESLRNKRLCSVDLAAMVAGTKYRGQFEERIKGLMKEVVDVKNIMLFFDELHTIIGAGGSEGGMDAANILKPALARGEMQCIGATTLNEYRKYIEKDGALERRFQPIVVDPPSVKETINILRGLQATYERHHNVSYTDEALTQAAVLSDKFVSDRFLPDKALDVIDEAGSRTRMDASFKPENIQDLEKQLAELDERKTRAVKVQKYEDAAKVRDEYVKIESEVEKLTEEWKATNADTRLPITESKIAEIVASMTNIPLTSITEEEAGRLLRIEDELHKSVISQDDAVKRIAQAVRRARAGLKNPNRPAGSFLFVGPTGVGKTLLCKVLAKFLFGSEDNLVQFDMSEYMEKHSVSRLIGAPPGYVGYDEGGVLTEKIRRKPYSVILFDEIEKAHPDIYNILLQIMEEGRLTDSFGRHVNFRNCIVVMTSNLGSDLVKSSTGLGFTALDHQEHTAETNRKTLMDAVEKAFRPEFINRLDDTIVFQSLTKDDMRKIIEIELAGVIDRMKENMGLEFKLSEEAKSFLLQEGWSEVFGARPLKRAIEKYVENPLAEDVLRGKFKGSKKVLAVPVGDHLEFQVQNATTSF